MFVVPGVLTAFFVPPFWSVGLKRGRYGRGYYGEFGGAFQQRIVTGGKLRLSKQVAEKEQQVAETAASAQSQRILNAVRQLYYQALGDQFRLQVRTRLAELAAEASRITDELANVGQADQPDQLAATVEAERIELELVDARNRQERTWRQLGTLVNDPRRTALLVSSANQRSTMFSQLELVGMKCRTNRGCLVSHRRTCSHGRGCRMP